MLVELAPDTDAIVTPSLSPVKAYDALVSGRVVPVTVICRPTAPSPAVSGDTLVTLGFASAVTEHAQLALCPPPFGNEALKVDEPVIDGPTETSAVSVVLST